MNEHQPEDREAESLRQAHPKIYAACLAAYNNGYLHGDWIYADQAPDDLHAEILDMLDKSPVPGGDEWAIHDYEGFGAFDLHEYERLETISRVAGGIALYGEAFAHWIHEVGSDADDAIETFDDAYSGSYDSYSAYAESYLDGLGFEPHDIVPDWISPFITVDYDGLGRQMAADLVTAEDQDGIHLFQPQ